MPASLLTPTDNCAVKMSTVEDCKRKFIECLQDVYTYHDFREILSILRKPKYQSTHRRQRDNRTVKEILARSMEREGAKKISSTKMQKLLENAKRIVAENAVRNTEISFTPHECLAEKIANELPWPACVPKEVVDAEKALLVAQANADGSPSTTLAITTASDHVESIVRQWTHDTVGKSREEYLKALIEQPVDISV